MAKRGSRGSLSSFKERKGEPAAESVHAASDEAPPKPRIKGQTLRLTEAAWRQLKEIALNEDCSVHHLLIEGVNEVFRKRGKPQIAEDTPAGSTVQKK